MNLKTILILVVILILAGAGVWRWQNQHGDDTTYQTAPVTKGEITQAVTATGTLNPVVNVQVGSQISGNIQTLFVDYNSPVKANQVVAQIDPATYQAVVAQAQGDLANAQAALELARVNATRTQALRDKNATPQATLDTALATLHQAEANVKVKEGALARAQVDLDHCKIYSPIDGIVISRSVDVGQTVAASMSAPVIFTIANDLAKMQIDTSVAEADVGNMEVGQNVDFTVDAFPYRTFHGTVAQVRNAATTVQNVVTYDCVISVNNDDLKLKPGMTANVSIIVAHRDEVLKIPNSALRFRILEPASSAAPSVSAMHGKGGGRPRTERHVDRTVYIQNSPKAKPAPVPVKVGISDGIFTEITEGLKESDQVVISSTGGPTAAKRTANPFGGGGPPR